MKKTLIIIFISLLCITAYNIKYTLASESSQYQTGDLIFQTTTSQLAPVIVAGTKSRFTHVGMIIMRKGKPYVYEASGPVGTVSLKRFVSRGVGKKYVVKRLDGGLTKAQKKKLLRESRRHRGKGYDSKFLWGDKRMYCSELVYKVYNNALKISLAEPQKMGDLYSGINPVVNKFAKKKYGKKLPLEETIVSPVRLYDSDMLSTIYDNYFTLN